MWSVPLLLAALFAHGTVGSFLGGTACHELKPQDPFRDKIDQRLFPQDVRDSLGWWDSGLVSTEPHPPSSGHGTQRLRWRGGITAKALFEGLAILAQSVWLEPGVYVERPRRPTTVAPQDHLDNDWFEFVLPESDEKLRRDHRNWARFTLLGHALLAALFIATGHWFLIVIVNLGGQYCNWLGFLCGTPQHYGLSSNVPDHRICCRTYTCSWLPAFTLLEHAVPRRTSHVPRRPVLQSAQAAKSH